MSLLILAGVIASVKLAWDYEWGTPNDGGGFRIYYGTATSSYAFTKEVPNPTARIETIDGLQRGTRYYFVMTAYNASGLESLPSEELACTVPWPLLPPTDVMVANGALKWTHAQTDLQAFTVYEVTETGARQSIATVEGTVREYALLKGSGTHTYAVTAWAADGRESAASNSVTVIYPLVSKNPRITVTLQTSTNGMDWEDEVVAYHDVRADEEQRFWRATIAQP